MKKVIIILSAVAVIAGSCGQRNTKKQDIVDNTECEISLESEDEIENAAVSEINENPLDGEDFGNKENPLYGKIYGSSRNLSDYIPDLRSTNDYYQAIVIQANKDLGIDAYMEDNGNVICIFNKMIIREDGKTDLKILDTIRTGVLKEREYLMLQCGQDDTIWDGEIFATFLLEDGKDYYDEEYFDKVIRAWRADINTGRIIPIENLKGIIGINHDCAD